MVRRFLLLVCVRVCGLLRGIDRRTCVPSIHYSTRMARPVIAGIRVNCATHFHPDGDVYANVVGRGWVGSRNYSVVGTYVDAACVPAAHSAHKTSASCTKPGNHISGTQWLQPHPATCWR